MARTRSIAGQAASAAGKVIPRRSKEADGVEQGTTVNSRGEKSAAAAKKSPAASTSKKSATTKKSTGEKSATTKTTGKKTTGKKSTTQTSTAKKAPAKKTSAKKSTPAKETTTAKKTPAKKTTAKKSASAKKTTAKKSASAKKTPAKKTPAKKTTPVNKSSTKKSSATKAAAADLVVREDEHAWTTEELAEVLGELHEQRAHSLEVIGQHQTELDGLMREPGDGAGHDQADVGSSAFERDHELQVLGNERDKLTQIDRALVRIENGTYGQCERCGNPIGKMRLMAFPRATLCMTCKQREERR